MSFGSAREAFEEALSAALTALASSSLLRLDTAILAMSRVRWGEIDSVGDTSSYVGACQMALQESGQQIRNLLGAIFFGAYCDKTATGFFQRYQAAILKLKRVLPLPTSR